MASNYRTRGGAMATPSKHEPSITTTPSKPKTPNPYLNRTPSWAPSASTSYQRTKTQQSSSVKNPYAKPNRSCKPVARTSCTNGSAKRMLNYSTVATEQEAPPHKKISPPHPPPDAPSTAMAAAMSSVTRDLRQDFDNSTAATTRSAARNLDSSVTYTLYFDGGSRGNPGIAGAGMVIYRNSKNNNGHREIWCGKKYLGNNKTNNEAEYMALLTGLECANHLGIECIHVKGDSKLVVEQVLGRWNCHKPQLRVLLQQVWDVKRKFRVFDIAVVSRDENRRADQLANSAMNDRDTDLGVVGNSLRRLSLSSAGNDIVEGFAASQRETMLRSTSSMDDSKFDEELRLLKMPSLSEKESDAFEVCANAHNGPVIEYNTDINDASFHEEPRFLTMSSLSQEGSDVVEACKTTQCGVMLEFSSDVDNALFDAELSMLEMPPSQNEHSTVEPCPSTQSDVMLDSCDGDDALFEEELSLLEMPPSSQDEISIAKALTATQSDVMLQSSSDLDHSLFEAELSSLEIQPLSQEESGDAMQEYSCDSGDARIGEAIGSCLCSQDTSGKDPTTDEMFDEELCLFLRSNRIAENEMSRCLSQLPFLVRFEMERLNLQINQRLKTVWNDHKDRVTLTSELISAIYKETDASCAPSYDSLLKHSLEHGFNVDEGDSCMFLFHAKFTQDGIELLPPEPADVMTRRIHRKFGSHRFLNLKCDQKCTESLVTLRRHLKDYFNSDNKLHLAGRRYGIIYSNPSEMPVVFRLFAESGVGIKKCDEISTHQVAESCIPLALNPGLSLTSYMKRMQLSFTLTMPSLALEMGMLEAIPDIKGVGNCENVMTDGCGLISRGALNKVYTQYTHNLKERSRILGKKSSPGTEASCPYSSFQGRIGGIKGMFVVDDTLEGIKVQFRPSQLKYNTPMTSGDEAYHLGSNDPLYNTVEVMEWDKKGPPHAHLCQNTIQLLEERGVPKGFFISLAGKEIFELKSLAKDCELLTKRYRARKHLRDNPCIFDDDILFRMLHAGIPLDEPVMMRKVNDFINSEFKAYREKSRFQVIESRYLRMLPDHTGLLQSDEAYVAVGDEGTHYEITRLGSIVAMRLPSYFPNDIRKLKVVTMADLLQRCPVKGKFFCGIFVGLVLPTTGNKSIAEMMSGGDFDGDTAWCCWNDEIVSSIQECSEHNPPRNSVNDPWKKRSITYSNADWTNLIIAYTMHHRYDKWQLGKIVRTLETMRDSPNFSQLEVDDTARKAFVQVDNPFKSQWTKDDEIKYGTVYRPHWHVNAKQGKSYHSEKVLGQLSDILDEAGTKDFNVNDIEPEMNPHIRRRIENAEKMDAKRVNTIRADMLKHLKTFNKAMAESIARCDPEDEVESRLRSNTISALYKQHRLEIMSAYELDDTVDLYDVFAILYEQTYIESRKKMQLYNGKPYIFAWGVSHDYLTRIIADGEAGGIAVTVVRGNDRRIFGK